MQMNDVLLAACAPLVIGGARGPRHGCDQIWSQMKLTGRLGQGFGRRVCHIWEPPPTPTCAHVTGRSPYLVIVISGSGNHGIKLFACETILVGLISSGENGAQVSQEQARVGLVPESATRCTPKMLIKFDQPILGV